MLKIGARAHDYGKDAPRELFGRIRSDGYEGIQLAFKKAIAGIGHWQDITPAVLEETRGALNETGLGLPVLGTYVELASPSEELRKSAVEEFLAGISFAQKLGAGCVGTETTNRPPQTAPKEAMRRLKDSLCTVLPKAEELGVIVAVEPVWGQTLNGYPEAVELLADIGSKNLQIIFDPVNLLNPADAGRQEEYFDRCFEALHEHIVAVHMKGARIEDGRKVSARFWDSVLDYEKVFGLLKQLDRDVFVLHEEADPKTAGRAMDFLKSFI